MQSIKTILTFLLLSGCFILNAQTSYTQLGDKEYQLLDRLEIKAREEGFNASYLKPYSVKQIVQQIGVIDSLKRNKNRVAIKITPIDNYNITRFLMAHKEYTSRTSSYNNKKTSFNLIESNRPKFFFALNPVLSYTQNIEDASSQSIYNAAAGVKMRGLVGRKFAFDIYATGNQERNPLYVREFTKTFKAVPGFSNFEYVDSNALKFIDFRASAQWSVAKRVDMQVGYDRNFLGNGFRSLLLSDFSGNSLFLKLNTKLWKFNFENLYMQLTPQFGIVNNAGYNKFLRINTLSINATKWLNVGIFDAVVFGRKNGFEMNYILPFSFLRAMEQQSGSPDNALVGVNLKANLPNRFQVYSQILLDEFLLSELKSSNGWWANKFGYQLGVKYIDAFDVKNLDLQVELNRVRPFTYTHFDSVSNYSNNNMALAHPLGANFQELILDVKCQPIKRVYLESKIIYYYQGTDSAGKNMGNNILIDYKNRPADFGWNIGTGNKATCFYWNTNVSYEAMENLFIDAGLTVRNYSLAKGIGSNNLLLSAGIRLNFNKRIFEF